LKCTQCGHETVVEVKFCPSCGFEMAKAQAEAAASAEQPSAEAPQPAAPPPGPPGIVTIPLAGDHPSTAAPPPPPQPAVPPPAPPAAPPVAPPVAAAPPLVFPAGPPPAPPAGQPPPYQPAPVPVAAAAGPPKKGSKTWLWACGCGCLIVILGVVAFVMWGAKLAKDEANKVGKQAATGTGTTGTTVTTEDFEVIIPQGWERHADKEKDNTKLVVTGPQVGGKPLALSVDVIPLPSGMSLQEFGDQALAKYKDRKWTEDKTGNGVTLCKEDARRVAFTDSDGDNLFYLALANGKGYGITMISPTGTMGEQEKTFDQILTSFDLHAGSSGSSSK